MSELKEPLRRLLLKQEHLSVLIRQVENMAMAVEHQGIVDSNSDFGLLSAIESGKRFRFMEECLRVEFDFVTSQIERLHADLRDSESREGEEIWLDSGTETQVPVLGSVMDAQTYTNMGPETEAMDTGKSKQQEQEMTAEELSAFFGSSTEAGGQEEQAQAHHLEQQMGGMFQVARMAAGRPLCPNLNTRERDKVGDQVSGEMEMSELKRRLGRFMLMHKRLDMLLCQVKKMSATIKQASVGSKLDPTFFNHDFCARKKCRLMEHSLRTEIDAVLLRIGRLHVQIGEKTRKLHICDSETREGEEIWFDSGTETQVPVLGSAMDAQTYTDMGSETEAMDTGKSAMKQHEEMITEELFACFMSWIEGGGEEKVEVEEGVEENKEQAMEKQQEQEMTTQELFACFGSWTEGGGEEEVVVEQEVEKDKEQAMEKQQEQEMTTEELFACYVSWTEAGDQEDVEVEEGVQVEQEQEEHEEEQEMEVTMEERSKSCLVYSVRYPNPSSFTYERRFFGPFEYAMQPPRWYKAEYIAVDNPEVPPGASKMKEYDGPQCFIIAGNHDWFDGLHTFMRYIRHKSWLGGWFLPQKKSYFALQLPKGWWIFGLDLALHGDIDVYQFKFFAELCRNKVGENDSVIMVTHEPNWLAAEFLLLV